ncbi:MAG: UDP-N-acetylmuramate:L-alanyl-gamma-D-glutamyl-meso-diaminopimelate ligase [Betaproteobacteria bacterium]|nr:MAG: UDP-N-acetylmuramate:L-alanyl-gamma-D-glutamyl-meso-diaminopimelate ligase [Betaproteobacteria bacterium]
MHLHILGICGTFMGGIAAIAREAGHRVTGCDANVYPPMSTQLEAQGIALIEGYGADQIALGADVYVIGNVVTRGNPLMEEILDRGLPYISGPQWLAENILPMRPVAAVAGTHGKTTTTAMLAWILESAGCAPGFLVGGAPLNFEASARLGQPQAPFVIEADEYDTAFFDKRSKFVHYRPRVAVLNNLEFDHADIFPDLSAIETQFHHLVRIVPRSGLLVVNALDANLARVLERGCYTPIERFGVADGWQAGPLDREGRFEVTRAGKSCGTLGWDILGRHNQLNALAAVAAAGYFGVDPGRALKALESFRNVRRRLEVIGRIGGITVYDDFAHHPSAIETTVAGLRSKVGPARILAVLEPRSNTMKLGIWKDALAASLQGADRVFCYGAGVGWDVRAAMTSAGEKARVIEDLDDLVESVAREARSGDHVLIMSNGGFGGLHRKLVARFEKKSHLAELPVRQVL